MRYTLPSIDESVADLEKIVAELSDRFDIPGDRYGDILISLTEAVNNAICHGNKYDKHKKVSILSRRSGDLLRFQVKDEGKGFSPGKVADPLCQERLEKEGGRGLFLIQQLSDNVQYLNNGNTVEIVFQLS